MRVQITYAALAVALFAVSAVLTYKYRNEPMATANFSELALTEGELQTLPELALKGNCEAATRLGTFYFALLGDPDKAEQWLRLSDRCSKDARAKEFLIRCISFNAPSTRNIADIRRILDELDLIDPVRSQRLRPSLTNYLEAKTP